jgi:hypothetical protein
LDLLCKNITLCVHNDIFVFACPISHVFTFLHLQYELSTCQPGKVLIASALFAEITDESEVKFVNVGSTTDLG